MNPSSSRDTPPMAEPGRTTTAPSTGGIASSADRGIADGLARDAERTDAAVSDASGEGARAHAAPDTAKAPASAGAAPSAGGSGGAEKAGAGRTSHPNGFEDEDDGEADAAVPRALPDSDEPRDESAAESLGRSISEVVTGGTHENKVEDKPATHR